MPRSSHHKIEYNKKYNKEHNYANQARYHETHPSKTYGLRVFVQETDIIEQLESQKNKSSYLKELIRADIKRQKEHN